MIDYSDIEEILSKGQKVTLKVRGTSMYPYLFSGDKVTLIPFDLKYDQINKEDILFVKTKKQYLIHRFHQIKDTHIVTKGDNLVTPDEEVQSIIGRVIKTEKNFKSFIKRLYYIIMRPFYKLLNFHR